MSEVGRIVGVLQVRDEATAVIGKFNSAAQSLFGTMKDLGGGIGAVGNIASSAFGGFATGGPIGAALGAGTALVGEFSKTLDWAIGEAKESEQVMKDLSIAVEKAGTSWESVSTGTEQALAALQKTTTFSDEQLAGALQRLLSLGLSYDEAMKALGATVDFAAARHMDLEGAATIVGRAVEGNTGILKRYGVEVTTSKDATAALKAATDTVAASLEANKGSLDGFKDSLGDMGVKVNDADGKMRGFKDIAADLVGLLAAGKVDTEEYGQTLADLGIDVDTLKLSAADADDILAALNTQFGGTAQEAAETYAGTQERLKNAMSDVGEKIGNMVLPALAAFTEGMIPVVDQLGKGIDAVGAWLTEVGKMPEVQAIVNTVQGAFDGLWEGMQDFWGFLAETFGPVLEELGGAFREIFDALAPIGEAFGEVWAAITGGQEGGDWLKDFLKFVAQFIREVVVPAIKEAVPIIKGFADAFKAAADFALPIITTIKDAVVGFIEALKTTFYGFYTWLVGGSLWMDMWNQLLSVASGMVSTLLGDLGSKLFEPMKTAFTGVMQAVEDLWTKGWDAVQTGFTTYVDNFIPNLTAWGDFLKTNVTSFTDSVKSTWDTSWQAVQTTFTTISDQIGAGVNTKFTEMRSFVQTNLGEYAPIATSALDAMQSVTEAGLDILKGDWQGALDHINNALSFWGEAAKGIMTGIMSSIQGVVQSGVGAIQGIWAGLVSGLQQGIQSIQSAFAQVQGAIQTLGAQAQTSTQSAMTTVTNTFQDAFNTISNAATDFWNWLVGHSLWTDMLNKMEGETDKSLMGILRSFGDMFKNIRSQAPIGAALQLLEGIFPIQQIIAETANLFTYGLGSQIVQQWEIIMAGFAMNTRGYLDSVVLIFRESLQSILDTVINLIGAQMVEQWIVKLNEFLTATLIVYDGTAKATLVFLDVMVTAFTTKLEQLGKVALAGMANIQGIFASGFAAIAASAASSMAAVVASVSAALAQVQSMQAQAVSIAASMPPMGPASVTPEAILPAATPAAGGWTSPTVGSNWIAGVNDYVFSPTITVPVSVQVDGATVAKTVETRLIQEKLARGRWPE